jgi:hypothetical protein
MGIRKLDRSPKDPAALPSALESRLKLGVAESRYDLSEERAGSGERRIEREVPSRLCASRQRGAGKEE